MLPPTVRNMVPLKDMPRLLEKLLAFDAVAKA